MEGIVSFGVQKLWELLSQEHKHFQGVEDQVTELQTDLLTLKSFLKDAEAKKHTSATVKICVEHIKEIIYDAEDVLETFLLKEKFRKRSGIKNRIRRLACIIPERREFALEMEGISKRISKVIGDMEKLEVIADGGSVAQPLHDRQREMRQTFSSEYESNLVGLEESTKKLVELMVEEENIQVVSITGMGGVGKTTHARQVFNHEKVKHHFIVLAWVYISQEFTRKYVWQTILRNLRPKEDGKNISEMTEPELQGELYQLLGTSKSLIVLDDIWKEEDWDVIKKILPPGKGSKVLLTSRKMSIVGRSDRRHINFPSECLSEKNSWTLLQRIAFPRKDVSERKVKEMEYMGMQMIKHCGGLPLAIKVLGGLLAENYTMSDWERISESIRFRIFGGSKDNNNGSVDHILSLSFEELPNHLKYCFLYLAHFPEDHTIYKETLSYYWAAEEIIPKARHYNEETIEDVGFNYIKELARRNMVIVERRSPSMRFVIFRLHDMMREICLSKAKEENFLQTVGIYPPTADTQSYYASRRLVLHNPAALHVERDLSNPKLRSLLIVVGDDVYRHWMLSCSNFSRLQLLRVLDLTRAEFKGGEVPSSIGNLIHLRYLSLHMANVTHLPSSLRNLKLLIYLNIQLSERDIFVPDILMEMQELRYLALPWHMHEKTKLQLSNLVNLETLENFSTRSSSIEDLHGMVRLRELNIILNDETNMQTLSASIAGMRHLNFLTIEDHGYNMKIEEGLFLDLIHLKRLEMNIHMPRLPNEQQLPSNLTYIVLYRCKLEEDPMPILEKLSHLEVVSLLSDSFCGRRMVCSGYGFPQLQILELCGLVDLEKWIVEEGSMPLLRTLEIRRCENLKELPDGLRFINSLKELSVDMKWNERLREGGEDYYKVQHIPSIKLIKSRFT